MPKFSLASCTLKKLLLSGSTFNLCHTMQSFLSNSKIHGFRDPSYYELRMLRALISNKIHGAIIRNTWEENFRIKPANFQMFPNLWEDFGVARVCSFSVFSVWGISWIYCTSTPPYPTTGTNEGLGRDSLLKISKNASLPSSWWWRASILSGGVNLRNIHNLNSLISCLVNLHLPPK